MTPAGCRSRGMRYGYHRTLGSVWNSARLGRWFLRGAAAYCMASQLAGAIAIDAFRQRLGNQILQRGLGHRAQ